MNRRTLLATAGPLGVMALTRQSAKAATVEIRFARQFSMGYLQFNVMEHQNLVEKHARALGLDEVKVTWVTFNGPEAMNGALISGSVDVVAGGIPGLVTFWARTRASIPACRSSCAWTAGTRNWCVMGSTCRCGSSAP